MSYKKEREYIEKQALRELEQDFTNITVERMLNVVEQKKNEILDDIKAFAMETKTPLIDSEGNVIKDKKGNIMYENKIKGMPEFVINQRFFKSLCSITSKEPKYSAEKMGVVFSLYQYIIQELNMNVGKVIPNKSHFCSFIGITQSTYNGYKNSEDSDMCVVMEKIDDYLSDAQFSMAQEGKIREKTTLDRLNIEMDKKKNYNPQVVVKAEVKDLESYERRIQELESMEISEYEIEE